MNPYTQNTNGVTGEQVAAAKEIDLLTYMKQHEPNAIRKCANNEYCLIEHDSLKISNGMWHWFSQNKGGKTALDFLVHVRGMGFVDAVRTLMELPRSGVPPSQYDNPNNRLTDSKDREPIVLPERNANNDRIIAYLRSRGIDNDVIEHCIKRGVLYESREYHACVFVGYNGDTAAYASIRATKSNFKKEVTNSDKRYSFAIPTADNPRNAVYVFESAIDTLSHATMEKERGTAWNTTRRLSLGGVSPLTLMQYLKDNPAVRQVALCLDNDKTGITAAKTIADTLNVKGYQVAITYPKQGKDWNEYLQILKDKPRVPRCRGDPHI